MCFFIYTIFYYSDLWGTLQISFSVLSHFEFMAFPSLILFPVSHADVGNRGGGEDGDSNFDAQIVTSS